jgi:LPXTG-motif cell wall-anchored protein
MKKLALVLATAVAYCLVVVAPALAQYPPQVEGTGGGNGGTGGGAGGTDVSGSAGGTAFTGVDVSLWMVLLAVLAVAGIAALVVSRRKASAS